MRIGNRSDRSDLRLGPDGQGIVSAERHTGHLIGIRDEVVHSLGDLVNAERLSSGSLLGIEMLQEGIGICARIRQP